MKSADITIWATGEFKDQGNGRGRGGMTRDYALYKAIVRQLFTLTI